MRDEGEVRLRVSPTPRPVAQTAPSSVVRSAIRATFNAAAPHFDAEPLFFWDAVGRRTVELAGIARGSRVLDVCCGTGASALPAAAEVGPTGSVIAVDLADRLLTRGRAKARALHLDNVEFTPGDMEALRLPDACADVVLCVLGLYYAQDPPRALAELWRVLRPGGTLAVTLWGERALEPGQTLFLSAVADERPEFDSRAPRHTSRLGDPSALTEAFQLAGVHDPTILQETLVHPCTPDDFWTIVLGSGYRIALDAMGPTGAARVRTSLHTRMQRGDVHELTSDVMYARVRKD